jgi:hypothetical protein
MEREDDKDSNCAPEWDIEEDSYLPPVNGNEHLLQWLSPSQFTNPQRLHLILFIEVLDIGVH